MTISPTMIRITNCNPTIRMSYWLLHSVGCVATTPYTYSCIMLCRGLRQSGGRCYVINVKPQSHQACDQVTTYLRPKNGPIVERTYDWWQRSYDWWQRSWVIARGNSVATKVVVMFKTRSHRAYDQVTTYLRSKNVGMMGQS